MMLIAVIVAVISIILPMASNQGFMVDDYVRNVMMLPEYAPPSPSQSDVPDVPARVHHTVSQPQPTQPAENFDTLQTNFNFDEDASPRDFM